MKESILSDLLNRRLSLLGANLPLLVKLAKARHKPMAEAVACALTAGRKYINCVDGLGAPETTAAL